MDGAVSGAWKRAARVSASYNFTYRRPGEPTTVYVAQDATGLDIAFVAVQHSSIVANAHTNGSGVDQDDNVSVQIAPQGTQGFNYQFTANALGSRDQSSSENTAYAPQWTASASRTANGYVVTMHIPFSAIRAGGSKAWRVQFERWIVAQNALQVWTHAPGQFQPGDMSFAGTLLGVENASTAVARRPQPRLQLYALGVAAAPSAGGDTSRAGADVAIPVTLTSSLLGTFHPDYSNVEVDQQTIAPTAFARQYGEVRPFFTQLSQHFNNTMSCNNCPQTLYTPAIPAFRDGYAYEGTQGPFSFGAFDAVGYARTDDAQALTYSVGTPAFDDEVSLQRVGVELPGFQDVTTSLNTGYLNQHSHVMVYGNAAVDRGTGVTQPGLGSWYEIGTGYVAQNDVAIAEVQGMGAQFAPADGYVQQNDIYGGDIFVKHTITLAPESFLQQAQVQLADFAFRDHAGNRASRQEGITLNFTFKDLLGASVSQGYAGFETTTGAFLPFNQNGITLSYKGQTSTPTAISYFTGSYYDGRLSAWTFLTTLPVTRKLNLSLETDRNLYAPLTPAEPAADQWLERATLDWQFSRAASFDVGARRIIGRNLPNAFQAPDLPTPQSPFGTLNGYAPFDYVDAGNVSFALHDLTARNEFYLVYGNPNSLQTTPGLYFKWIRYIGAEKGT